MKYGPIICDPTSEEAKKLVGKKVIATYSYTVAMEPSSYNGHEGLEGVLFELDEEDRHPFHITYGQGRRVNKTFIREVIEEEPQYRPYKDTEEMVEDFKKRFCGHTTVPQFAMPLIWVTFPSGPKEIVSAFGKTSVWLNGDCLMLDYVFENRTYLDGSPVGKEVQP